VERLVVAVGIVLLAAAIAAVVRRARRADPPTHANWQLPSQLDRRDFDRPGSPWLVVVFSSASCSTCADVIAKAHVLESPDVAVQSVPYQDRPDLHTRYGVEAVPGLVVADAEGVVRASFLGPVTATDLWASLAAARSAGPVASDDEQ
jgi:hypothetical protein